MSPEKSEGTDWGSPGEDEVKEAISKHMGDYQGDEGEGAPIEAPASEGETETGAPETPEEKASSEKSESSESDPTFVHKGRKYTSSEVAEAIDGSMRQEDYSRSKNDLKGREDLLESRSKLLDEREELLSRQGLASKEEPDPEFEPGSLEESNYKLQKQVDSLRATVEGMQRDGQESEAERHQEAVFSTYTQAAGDFFRKNNITDKEEQQLYHRVVMGENPDDESGYDVLSNAVTDILTRAHGVISKQAGAAASKKIDQLRGAPTPPAEPSSRDSSVGVKETKRNRKTFDDDPVEDAMGRFERAGFDISTGE
jgi:hypothetical protein